MQEMPPMYDHDAFISYSHSNNLLLDDEKGWVDNFHERLENFLTQHMGRKPLVWRDERLSKQVELRGYLHDRIKGTLALVAIISPGYLNSAWCMGELREFVRHAQENRGLYLSGKSRVFVVVKLPPETQPPEIAQQLSYDFYEIDKSGQPVEFGHDIGKNKDQRYWNMLSRLAWEIKEMLRESGLLAAPVQPDANIFVDKVPKRTIYLAETTEDVKELRRQISDELVLHGFKVLPDRGSDYAVDSYSESVQKSLQESSLSIHLLGRSYGLIPDGAKDRSVLRLQVELAAAQAKQTPGFRRLLWMPEGWTAADDGLSKLLDDVKTTADPRIGMEFWQTSLEEFKTLMHTRLRLSANGHKPSAEAATATLADDARRKVYLVCDRRDLRDANPIISYLHEVKGYEVILPEFDETDDDTLLTDLHQNNLLKSDGVLVYYCHGSSRWVSSKKADLEKHAGLEKTVDSANIRPLRAKAFYVTLPLTDLKEVFNTHVAPVIKNFGAFDPACLADFIRQLEGNGPQGPEGGN